MVRYRLLADDIDGHCLCRWCEVGKIEDMKKSEGLRSGSSDCSALSSTPGSVRSLAFSIFSVNGVSGISAPEMRRVACIML